MSSDFSAFDAELDALAAGVISGSGLADAFLLGARELADIDDLLDELARDVRSLPARARPFQPPASEEIVLPEPVAREAPSLDSGEISIEAKTPRSGSFALDEAAHHAPHGRDDTLEILDDSELSVEPEPASLFEPAPRDSDERAFPREVAAAATPSVRATAVEHSERAAHGSAQPPAALFERADAQFELESESADAHDGDAAFAELFADARRQSSMPSPEQQHTEGDPAEDTETFDSSVLGLEPARNIEHALAHDDLDSTEYELVLEGDVKLEDDVKEEAVPPSEPPPARRPSQAPEKRPSFLGRLFGRKEGHDAP